MIAIVGGYGQLGQCLKSINLEGAHFFSKDELDITSVKQIRNKLSHSNFQTIINCAAYTNVDQAESEVSHAKLINHDAVKNLVTVCLELNITLIHISTDYVFDGDTDRPYSEDDNCSPINMYGKTKYDGEQEILKSLPNYYIIRTSWLYSEFSSNFVKNISNKLLNDAPLKIVNDQQGTPTYGIDLAHFLKSLVQHPSFKTEYGIFHFSSTEPTSWYQLTKEIQTRLNSKSEITPIKTSELNLKANRPTYSALNCTKVHKIFGVKIPLWKESLEICLKNLMDKKSKS